MSCISNLGAYSACGLFFDLFGLFSMFFVILILSLYLGTSSASEPWKSSVSIFCRSFMFDLCEHSACRLLFALFGQFLVFFCDFNIVSVYLDNSWASEPLKSSVSICHISCMSDLGKYSTCVLLFDLFDLFSLLFLIINIICVY
jgi:hypothetical protein